MKKWYFVIAGVAAVALIAVAIFLLKGTTPAAATVNGVAIPAAAVEEELAQYKSQQPAIFNGPAGQAQEKKVRESILNVLITEELLRQEARKRGVRANGSEIDAKIDQVKKMFPDKAQFEQVLKQQGLTEAELRVKASDQVIADKMVKLVTGKLAVSEADLKDFYNKNKTMMTDPEQKRWRHIVVKDKAKADKLRADLEDGADFAKLAKANSIDANTKNNGGDLGLNAPLPPEVVGALKDVKVNEISEVVKGADGYHVYELTELKEARQKPYKDVKEQIRQYLVTQRQRDKFTAWLESVKKKAAIVKAKAK